ASGITATARSTPRVVKEWRGHYFTGRHRMKAKGLFATALMTATIVGGVFAATGLAAARQADKKAAPAKKAEPAAKKTEGAKTVEITGDDTMKFSVTAITAKPGEAVHIKLTNKGTMPKMAAAHNFVLLKKGTDL